jgi:hypothetical protein
VLVENVSPTIIQTYDNGDMRGIVIVLRGSEPECQGRRELFELPALPDLGADCASIGLRGLGA